MAENNEAKDIVQAAPKSLKMIARDTSVFENLLDTAKFEHMWRVAQIYAKSKIVPAHYQNEPENCFIALQMSVRLCVDPFMFMQKTYVVGGKPGMEAQLAISLVNSRGPFKGAIQWKMDGEGMSRQATAMGVHRETGEVCTCTVTMKIAEAEGWITKNGSKWRTMPDQMLRYRSAAWLARLYAPECLMGMQTEDELEDITAPIPVRNTLADLPSGRSSFVEPRQPEAEQEEPPPELDNVDPPPMSEWDERRAAAYRLANGCNADLPGCVPDFSVDASGKPVCANHAPRTQAVPEGDEMFPGAKKGRK